MKISVLNPNDIQQLPSIQPPTWYDIRPIHEFYVQAPYCYTCKAEIGNEMVGAGTVIFHDDVAWLAHILVHENHRKKGIGKAISEHVLNAALNKGLKTVYLKATDLGAPVYTKLGFELETEYLIYKDFTYEVNMDDSEYIRPYVEGYKEDILALDQAISGENRIDNLCLYLKTGFVYIKDDVLKGFYLPDCGEGLIVSNDKDSGIALIQKRLKEKPTAIFPKENRHATAFMNQLNIEPVGTIRRMRFGEERPLDLSGIYNRIGGNLG